MGVVVALIRIVAGFLAACLVAAAVLVLFVITPGEVAALSGASQSELLSRAASLVPPVAVTMAIFAAPLVLVAAAFAEWQGLRRAWFYGLAGIAIAGAGFLAQHWGEAQGQPTILNTYALGAMATTGLVAGLVYWLIAGRLAGHGPGDPGEGVAAGAGTDRPDKAGSDLAAGAKAPLAPVARPGSPMPGSPMPGSPIPGNAPTPLKDAAPAADKPDTTS